jgi:hypothetical protein
MQASAAKTALGCSVFTLGATVKYTNPPGHSTQCPSKGGSQDLPTLGRRDGFGTW